MNRLALAISTAICLIAVPAVAGSAAVTDKPITLAQSTVSVGPNGVGVDVDSRDRDRDHYRDRDRDRRAERDHERCHTVTVRERHGDDTVTRKTRQCD
jgi:hypothetical protein